MRLLGSQSSRLAEVQALVELVGTRHPLGLQSSRLVEDRLGRKVWLHNQLAEAQALVELVGKKHPLASRCNQLVEVQQAGVLVKPLDTTNHRV